LVEVDAAAGAARAAVPAAPIRAVAATSNAILRTDMSNI
jgi:hypothetical protein